MRSVMRYGAALLLVAVAAGVSQLIPYFAQKTPFLLFFGAVSLAAWYGGFGPAMCATILSVLLVNYLFIPPRHLFSLTLSDLIIAVVFSGIAALISYLTTAQHHSDQARRESDERLQIAMTAAGMGAWQWNIAADTLEVSSRLEKILGVPHDSLKTLQAFSQSIHPDDRLAVHEEIARAINEKDDYDIEYRVILADASTHWISARGRAFYDAQGKALRMAGVAMDITSRRKMEAERRALEERFRLMADSAPVKIWICDTNNQGTWYNKRWLQFTGRSMEQELGTGWAASVHPDDLPRAVETCNAAFHARQPFTMEFRLRRHDGEYRWVVDTGVPLYDDNKQFTGYIGSCIDITERKLAEEERQQLLLAEQAARGEAERISHMKDEFIATLSHELRTPLNAILGWASLLRSRKLSEIELEQGLETIERNALVQTQLIEDLLDMSRGVLGKLRLEIQPVHLISVLDAAIEAVRPAAEAKGILLHKMLDSQVSVIQGDPNRLQQIMWNLLSNAVKFTPNGGRVQVNLERTPTHVEITVIDTGQGIHPSFLPYVFEMFRQEDSSSTRRHSGLGLGLGIVKQLVELHGGTVSVESAGENQGTSFCVSLPVIFRHEAQEEMRQQKLSPQKRPPNELPSLSSLKVLVVDDDPDTRRLISRLLQEYQAEVVTADSAAQAIKCIESEKPSVLVSDIGMPESDGYELIRCIRALAPEQGGNIPAIALTAFAQTQEQTHSYTSGFQKHLAKPVEPAELVTAIAQVARLQTNNSIQNQ